MVYGVASVTGGWLGTPPWWTKAVQVEGQPAPILVRYPSGKEIWMQPHPTSWLVPGVALREGREWISGGVVAVGLGLVAVGAWPRRRRVRSTL